MLENLKEKIAIVNDLPRIIEVEKDLHISPWTLKNFRDALSAKNLFKIFTIDSKLVGYYVALFATDECQLLNVSVHKNFQNKGVGNQLMTSLKKNCVQSNISSIFLEVRASNKKAMNLYQKNGFNEIGIRNNYYKTHAGWEDAILMGTQL